MAVNNPTTMLHSIHHSFITTKRAFGNCNVCDRQILFRGYRCTYCKVYCHSDCVSRAPNSCGLPKSMCDIFKEHMERSDTTPNSPTSPTGNNGTNFFGGNGRESTLNRSPSLISTKSVQPHKQEPLRDILNISGPLHSQSLSASLPTDPTESRMPSNSLVDSEKSSSSTLTAVSQNSSSTDYHYHPQWPSQGSLSSTREWDIPFDELQLDQVIGTGRYSTVYQGYWHGEVAIKQLHHHLGADERALESFKQEVDTFRMTRHDNLVLFMGACMTPPHLAIVTSMCKGVTLHSAIHGRKSPLELADLCAITEQVCQGMGYLHSRDILHKDLKTKNIFWQQSINKVVITDFGLSSVAKLCVAQSKSELYDRLVVPQGWLCYLAPEIIRTLSIALAQPHSDHLPYSAATDIYAFGTLLYEMIFGEYPFRGRTLEVLIWQVGKGMRHPVSDALQAPSELRELLAHCWAFHGHQRPTFAMIQYQYLQKIPKPKPKKRIQLRRCPSHPALL